ncbi:MAG: DUF4838 domain-containing protein [Planctomycetaceae bacterium]|nr:DUF4838 domain-containing protein [Planctomycetaceae bacterium]
MSPNSSSVTRRDFVRATAASLIALSTGRPRSNSHAAAPDERPPIRGVVMVPETLTLENWPGRAKKAGLNTIVLHHPESPRALLEFVKSDQGQAFLAQCATAQINVEFDFHAMRDLVPRELFASDPSLFRMDEAGKRSPMRNFCVHSPTALQTAAENAVKYAESLPPTTASYYFWSDGCAAWCRCPRCRELSDSDQLLIVENALVAALRKVQPEAQVAHLACHTSMPAPQMIKPAPGVFLQYAPVRRRYDVPYSQQTDREQIDSLWYLEQNLKVFPEKTAQVLEYWLDVTRFPPGTGPLPWNRDRFQADLKTYTSLGIRHFKSFANGIDANYVTRHGEPTFLAEYGRGLQNLVR